MKASEQISRIHGKLWAAGISQKIEFDDAAISVLALISMYQTITFLILQLLLFIPVFIVQLYLESQKVDESQIEKVVVTLLILIELVLIYVLARKGKARFKQYMATRESKDDEVNGNQQQYFQTTLTETGIEKTIGIAALAGISWGLFIGVEIKSLQILLVVIEAAAFLFLSIFLMTRFLATRKVRPFALVFLVLTGVSIWALLT